jgi:hypothetical protein
MSGDSAAANYPADARPSWAQAGVLLGRGRGIQRRQQRQLARGCWLMCGAASEARSDVCWLSADMSVTYIHVLGYGALVAAMQVRLDARSACTVACNSGGAFGLPEQSAQQR